MKKYGLLLGDFHCGHLIGLTSPDYQLKVAPKSTTKRNKWYTIAKDLWAYFEAIVDQLPPLDFIVANGDLIEGKGKRSGGTELFTSDMKEQCDMAVSVFDFLRERCCKKEVKIVGTYGTDYHTATDGDDWENLIARDAGFHKIGSQEWVEINGCVLNIKHHIGSSSIPHGRGTQILKEMLWSQLWAETALQPKSDVVIRSHAHYYMQVDNGDRVGMILPALQGMGSKFGARRCSGLVSWGCILCEIDDKGNFDWTKYIHRVKSQTTSAIVV